MDYNHTTHLAPVNLGYDTPRQLHGPANISIANQEPAQTTGVPDQNVGAGHGRASARADSDRKGWWPITRA